MASPKQLLSHFQAQLQQFHQKEQIYRYKLEQLNQTRNQLANQIDNLHLDYNKKIKQMDNKIKHLISENDLLLRQNQIYKGQIQTFNSRLLQKEKLISNLVSQQRQKFIDRPILEASRSSRNQENKSQAASQGAQNRQNREKLFKKNLSSKIRTYKEDQSSSVDNVNQHNYSPNISIPTSQHTPQNFMQIDPSTELEIQKLQSAPDFNVLTNIDVKKKKPTPPPVHKKNPAKIIHKVQEQQIRQHNQIIQQSKKIPHNNVPKPPSIHKKPIQKKILKPIQKQQEHQQQHVEDNSNFLSHFQKDNEAQNCLNQQRNQINIQRQEQNQGTNLMTYFNQPQNIQNNYWNNQIDLKNQVKEAAQQKPKKVMPPKIIKKKEAQRSQNLQNSFEQYQTPSGLDFFNKLGQGANTQQRQETTDFFNKMNQQNMNEPNSSGFMNSDIQQSSIDYQDNSLMSSTANMFTDISDLTAPSKQLVKPKKKAKRDKIKVLDPSGF